jgi:hypothetical protein
MLVIATDGNPVAPVRVDSLILYSGKFLIGNEKESATPNV